MNIQYGVVATTDDKTARVKVSLREERSAVEGEQFLTDWLPILQISALKDHIYKMVDKGDVVACLLDDHCERGVVLGAIYTEDNKPTSEMNQDRFVAKFKDGTLIQYDRSSSELKIDAVGSLKITVGGNADIDINGVATIQATTGTINLLDSFTGNTKHLFI